MSKQKVIRIGNSLGITLPAKFVERLSLRVGDQVKLVFHDESSLILEFPDSSQLSLMSTAKQSDPKKLD
ncbi:hypothetical protein A2572_01685 [Candidatus Collierbacteria bacterium RIFOXYD1_FULL_40_9]|uniref:SpoVT-AbrB domain-containing protein n=1 Tax=Candidatus Collierbacteria bacterium RIFOXYD1_FULL_40_9 TaxID=1817731 RepID=A0A1F5FP86_9BACT|nr:MAG: hypothetical protein A2572_01685 [Candidatus Collierbacteria bacterium RIFOXYD1_FULL_40_9]